MSPISISSPPLSNNEIDFEQEQQKNQTNNKIRPLRICCYGSSSKNTLQHYIQEAYTLGQILGQRGHTCVNGAGATGCMGAMNQGILDTQGNVVGVIHEMFVEEGKGSGWVEGCHEVFQQQQAQGQGKEVKENMNAHLIVVGGDDLQERKKTLVKDADALIVMPGGPGTFDELWEMACAKQIGLIEVPIVCVNVNGYYDPFYEMLERAYRDQFLYKCPSDILHFENTSLDAVDYIEKHIYHGIKGRRKAPIKRKRSIIKRMTSMYNLPFLASSSSMDDDDDDDGINGQVQDNIASSSWISHGVTLLSGIALGFMLRTKYRT